ncbi:MAG: HAD family hydrolase [Victivallales bacterium]|nr:HAD family hydrolase [Victivallales bacterium]
MKLIALDFDGVICNSAPENAAVGWRICRRLWKDTFPQREITPADVERFCRIRPFLETGFQGPLMTWMLNTGRSEEECGPGFTACQEEMLKACGYTRQELKAALGTERDSWLAAEPEVWFDYNHLYPEAAEILTAALQDRESRVIILTTKEDRFVKAIFRRWNVPFPEENVYGLERIRTKEETLLQLMAECGADDVRFIEDRVETLIRFQSVPGLEKVKLYLADWGYLTPPQLETGRANPGIKVVSSLRELFV